MDVIRRNGRDAIKRGDTRAKVDEKSSRDIQTLTIINVNARKIELAKGRRQFETKDQGDVMASSAPDVCPRCRRERVYESFFVSRECILTEYLHNKKTARKLLDWQWIDPKSRVIGRVRTTKRQTDYHPNEMFNGLYIAEVSKSSHHLFFSHLFPHLSRSISIKKTNICFFSF